MTSSFTIGHAQIDGRRNIVETHILDSGDVKRIEYLAAVGTDYKNVMIARATSILADIAAEPARIEAAIDAEVREAVDKIAELSYKYPDKVSEKLKGTVDKETTEGLLSADGKPTTIDAPEGWKK